jgi:DNA polymerase delta subunit 4
MLIIADYSVHRSYEYGPCVGVSRLERWERASALGLNPPNEVDNAIPLVKHIKRPTSFICVSQVLEVLSTKQGVEQAQFSQSVFYEEV